MDGDINDIFQKLNTALEDPNMSNNLKNILNNFSSSNTQNTNTNSSTNTPQNSESTNDTNNTNFRQQQEENTSSNTENRKSNSSIPDFDLNTILKIKKIMDSMNSTENDSRSNLLLSLKPYLSDHKKDKIDQYVKFLRFAKVFETLNPMGGDSSSNE